MLQGTASSLPEIDFEGIADRADLPALLELDGTQVHRGMAFCPFHDNINTPALSIYQRGGRWRFRCHGCGARGDSIDYIAVRGSMTLVEAAKALGGETYFEFDPRDRPERMEKPPVWKDPQWQAELDRMIVEAEQCLWDEHNPDSLAALRWLRSRGLRGRTIRRFRLGFVPGRHRSAILPVLEDPDKPEIPARFSVRRGITIPWLAPKAWYSAAEEDEFAVPRWVGCNVRSLPDGDPFGRLPDDVPKYKAVRGSKRGFLYPWPDILPTQEDLPMLLVEGEFDSLLGFQEAGHLLHVGTAGSATVHNVPSGTLAALARTSWIFLAMDHDDAGVDAVFEWRERYPHRSSRALPPTGKDLSEFFAAGGDVRGWVAGLEDELQDAGDDGGQSS